MFYSQFILAKKDTLGTIWIAAHLKRKLGKNQVADTDIGVSIVDLMKPGATIILRNAKIDMFKGSMRLALDKLNRVEVTEPG
ncbi:hypothetical protein RHGRI_011232 [Rhododendron griersonianum]|uniref:Single-stranded DNA binding protein Ssb-like OB fold domain-containing protein n=1 Tax=Rhododendron griersonianum TaxID=479676 RepID=A0AAV6KL54_9ERIC|nr:hypothetical protein RHGRI_011232 [Rhododendron griersonianum]